MSKTNPLATVFRIVLEYLGKNKEEYCGKTWRREPMADTDYSGYNSCDLNCFSTGPFRLTPFVLTHLE